MLSYFEQQLREIDSSIHSMDENEFERLVKEVSETLETGHKVIVSGLGKNVPICEKFVGSMVSLGLDANFLHTNSAVHGDMGIVKNGDLVLLLSKSGGTQESVYLAELLQKRDVNLWLLSFEEKSSLTEIIPNRIILKLSHEGDLWNIMPNNSTTLNLIVLQGLVMQVAKEQGLTVEDFRRNHPGGHIGQVLKR